MTNYNERLDKILYAHNDAIKSLHHKIKYQNLNPTPDEILAMEDALSATAKQALTSLIKELVAEAKPEKKSTEDYGSWEEGHRNAGWNNCLEHYEQNLLKVLGYEDEK